MKSELIVANWGTTIVVSTTRAQLKGWSDRYGRQPSCVTSGFKTMEECNQYAEYVRDLMDLNHRDYDKDLCAALEQSVSFKVH